MSCPLSNWFYAKYVNKYVQIKSLATYPTLCMQHKKKRVAYNSVGNMLCTLSRIVYEACFLHFQKMKTEFSLFFILILVGLTGGPSMPGGPGGPLAPGLPLRP